MVVIAADLKYYLSGGADNRDSDAALGGVMSTYDLIPDGVLANLFDDVANSELSSDTEYRCYYIVNEHATDTLFSAEVFIGTVAAGTTIAIGLDPAGINGTATTIANESTAPAAVSFTSPTSSPGLAIGNLTAGDFQAIWVRRVTSSASQAPDDRVTLTHEGTDV